MIGTWRQRQAQQNMVDHLEADPQGRSAEEVISAAAHDAVETATTVKITQDAVDAFARAWHDAPQDGPPGTRRLAGLTAALTALGFEVIE